MQRLATSFVKHNNFTDIIFYILYVYSKVTYSQVHGSPVLKALSFKSLSWISATTFAEVIQFGQNPKLRVSRTF